MDVCYRAMPRLVGEFLDSIYQNPTELLVVAISLIMAVGWWRYKARLNH